MLYRKNTVRSIAELCPLRNQCLSWIPLSVDFSNFQVELDFAVPFLKIPLGTKRSGSHILEPLLEVNTRGLVTVATMLFLFITIIPKIVKLFIPHAHGNQIIYLFIFLCIPLNHS